MTVGNRRCLPARDGCRGTHSRQLLLLSMLVATLAAAVCLCSCLSGGKKPAQGGYKAALTMEQKLKDFRYLFQTLKESYPFLELKRRTEGYDWVAHEKEFEQEILSTKDDREFALAMSRIVLMANNMHTKVYCPEPWSRELRGEASRRQLGMTTEEKASYWLDLSSDPSREKNPRDPFWAAYIAGEYYVFAVAPEAEIQSKVSLGLKVVAVSGKSVHDYVNDQRGSRWLDYDPVRHRVYQTYLVLPRNSESFKVVFQNDSGQRLEREVPRAKSTWGQGQFSWPPKYAPKPSGDSANVYTYILADGKVAYLQLRSMTGGSADRKALRSFFPTIRDIPVLLIDIRGNAGGENKTWMDDVIAALIPEPVEATYYVTWRSSSFVAPFMEEQGLSGVAPTPKESLGSILGPERMANLPPEVMTPDFVAPRLYRETINPMESVNYGGKVYVLVDSANYSAAEAFTLFCKASGWATLIGSRTGGDGPALVHRPLVMSLPESGMLIRFTGQMTLNPDMTANEETHTMPDIFLEWTRDDFFRYAGALVNGVLPSPDPETDRVLGQCLRLILGSRR